MPNGDERFGGQVPQMVIRRRAPERAHSSMRERGAQTRGPHEIAVGGGADFVGWEMPGREIPGSPRNRGGGVRISWGGKACMGAKASSRIGGFGLRSVRYELPCDRDVGVGGVLADGEVDRV